jgi:esterase/lipase
MQAKSTCRMFFAVAVTVGFSLFSSLLFAFDHREVDDDGLVAEFYYNEQAEHQRPIIIFGGSDGGYILTKAQRSEFAKTLVDKGYAVLFLAYFDPKGNGKLPKRLLRIPLEYFETAMAWVGRQPGVRSDSIAVYGSSRGGELALLLATRYPQIRVVIAGVPSAYIWPTPAWFTFKSIFHPCQPAWTYQGKDIPGVCSWKMLFSGNKIIAKNPKKFERYFIPVETMSADVLLLSAKQDDVWPSTEMSDRIVQRLDRINYPHAYKHVAYDGGHFVFKRSWADVLSFLEIHYPARRDFQTREEH